jgi:hypothetical protein
MAVTSHVIRQTLAPALLLLASCGHWFPIPPERIRDYAAAQVNGSVQVTDGQRVVQVSSDEHPRLRLRFNGCSARGEREPTCVEEAETALKSVRFLNDECFSFLRAETGRQRHSFTARLVDVRTAEMTVESYRPVDWRPTWGLGLSLGGPGIGPVMSVTFLPSSWLALDLGGSAVTWVAYAGARVRFWNATGGVPFVGAFLNTGVAAGARAGVDAELFAGTIWLTVEFDLGREIANPLSYSYHLVPLGRNTFLWGGATVSYFF